MLPIWHEAKPNTWFLCDSKWCQGLRNKKTDKSCWSLKEIQAVWTEWNCVYRTKQKGEKQLSTWHWYTVSKAASFRPGWKNISGLIYRYSEHHKTSASQKKRLCSFSINLFISSPSQLLLSHHWTAWDKLQLWWMLNWFSLLNMQTMLEEKCW